MANWGERGLVDMNGGEEDNREGRGDRSGHGLPDTILTCQNSKFYTYAGREFFLE